MITQADKDKIFKLIDENDKFIKDSEKKLVVTIDPENPDDVQQSWLTPELHQTMNLQDQLQSFFKNFNKQSGSSKQTGLAKWFPIIAIVMVLIVGVMWYTDSNSMKNIINMMQQELQGIHNQINTMMP
jgi:PHP family Zn ribbon phosphoesterase